MADKKKITVGSTKVMPAEMYSMAPLNSVPNIDVALIKLSSSLPAPSGHVEPWDTPIYSGSSSSLVGNTYYCQGRGYNSCSTHVLALQSANLKAEYLQDEGFVMLPNSSGQIQMAGDSGSSCYQVVNGRYYIVGVQSWAVCGTSSYLTGADAIRDWVDSIIDRVGMVDGNGTFRVKEAGLSHAWVTQYSGAFMAAIAGPRVAMIRQSDEHCLVKEGALSNNWVDQWSSGGVVRCLLDGSRIGIITKDGVFRVKDGSISSTGWVVQSSTAASAVLSGNRIGFVSYANSHFYVKEGEISATWVDQYSDVWQGVLSGTRIGVLTNAGTFWVKDGSLSSTGWVVEATNVTQGALSGNRIGALSGDSHFYVKEGALDAAWVDEYANVVQATLSGKRIGVVANSYYGSPLYDFLVKEGDLSAEWVVEAANSSTASTAVLPNK